MKVIPHPTLPSQMLLGYRVASETDDLTSQDQAQQVLVAIVKGTFMADDPTATPLPVEQQIPIFLQDVFFNAVKNADFTEGEHRDSEGRVITPVSFWIADGPEITQIEDAGTTLMRVMGGGQVTQALTFGSPLGDRSFTLQFRARASANVTLNRIQVKSKSGEVQLAQTYSLTPSFQVFTSPTHTWSPELKDTEATLILQGTSGVTIDYDYVQLVEGSFSVIKNAGFAVGEQQDSEGRVITPVSFWIADGPEITQIEDAGTTLMRVMGGGQVTQALTFGSPLGDRSFTLQFRARASANVTLNRIQVKSKSGEVQLAQTYSLTPSFQVFTSPTHTWSPELKDTEATLILQGTSGVTIDYDYIKLIEVIEVFPFAPGNPIRYEHDLAIYKPLTDIVVLGKPEPLSPPPPGGVGPIGSWVERVRLGSTAMSDSFSNPVTQPFTFGWQSRVNGARGERNPIDAATGYAGFFGPDGTAFNPSTMKLPDRFNNLFFNGGLYRSADSPPRPVFAHPPVGTTITVESTATYQVGIDIISQTAIRTLQLPNSEPQAILTYRSSSTPDASIEQVALPLAIDTIVFDKHSNQFYTIWRGSRLIQQVGSSAELPLDRLVSLEFS